MGTPEGLLHTDNASRRVENGSRKALRDMSKDARERANGGASGGGKEA